VEHEEFRTELENDLIYLGSFGLDDPLRDKIAESISHLRYGSLDPDVNEGNQVNIRLVSGDHLDCAKTVALRSGIIKQEELQLSGIAMTGDQFREEVGGYAKIWDPISQEFKVEF
jgi:magnesium-transporting ATPase (P-type)